MLYAFAAVFLFVDLVNVLGTTFSGTARHRAHVGVLIEGTLGALLALLTARLLRPLCRLDVAGLRARTKRPRRGDVDRVDRLRRALRVTDQDLRGDLAST